MEALEQLVERDFVAIVQAKGQWLPSEQSGTGEFLIEHTNHRILQILDTPIDAISETARYAAAGQELVRACIQTIEGLTVGYLEQNVPPEQIAALSVFKPLLRAIYAATGEVPLLIVPPDQKESPHWVFKAFKSYPGLSVYCPVPEGDEAVVYKQF